MAPRIGSRGLNERNTKAPKSTAAALRSDAWRPTNSSSPSPSSAPSAPAAASRLAARRSHPSEASTARDLARDDAGAIGFARVAVEVANELAMSVTPREPLDQKRGRNDNALDLQVVDDGAHDRLA